MKKTSILLAAAFSLATIFILSAASSANAVPASDSGNGVYLAQYLEDTESGARGANRGRTIRDLQDKGGAHPKPRVIIGGSGGAEAREGFASVIMSLPLGVQYDQYLVTAAPMFIFTHAQSLRAKKGWSLDNLARTKISGKIYEFDIPVRFSYSFLDIDAFPYSPYVSAGIGYSLRTFRLNGSSFLSRTNRDFTLNSLTLNVGFGFQVKITEKTRFDAGIHIVTYFNERTGVFNYDTTGASLQLGLMTFLN